MKKFLIILIMLISMASMVSTQTSDDIYVRKDVFEVYMQNITLKLDMILEEQKAQRTEINSMRSDIHELTKAVAVLSERTDRNFEILSSRMTA